MEDFGDQVSPTNSLFYRYPLTTTLNFDKLSSLSGQAVKAKIKSDESLEKL